MIPLSFFASERRTIITQQWHCDLLTAEQNKDTPCLDDSDRTLSLRVQSKLTMTRTFCVKSQLFFYCFLMIIGSQAKRNQIQPWGTLILTPNPWFRIFCESDFVLPMFIIKQYVSMFHLLGNTFAIIRLMMHYIKNKLHSLNNVINYHSTNHAPSGKVGCTDFVHQIHIKITHLGCLLLWHPLILLHVVPSYFPSLCGCSCWFRVQNSTHHVKSPVLILSNKYIVTLGLCYWDIH